MILATAFALCLSATVSNGFVVNSPSLKTSSTVPRAYIVQLASDAGSGRSLRSKYEAHDVFRKNAGSIDYDVRRQFTNLGLFYGLSIEVRGNDSDASIRSRLDAIDGVKNIWPVEMIQRFGSAWISPSANAASQGQPPLPPVPHRRLPHPRHRPQLAFLIPPR